MAGAAVTKDEGLRSPLHEPHDVGATGVRGRGFLRMPAQVVEQDPRRGQRLREGHRAVG